MELHGSDRPDRSCGIELIAGRPVNSVVIAWRADVCVQMDANPYGPSAETRLRFANPSFKRKRFPFWTVGPLTGMSVGLTHVLAMVAAWAAHGYPDFLLRSGDTAFIFAIAMSIGGAIFGVPYACLVAICARAFAITVRARLQFWVGTVASFAVTYVAADLSLRRRELIPPFIVLATIIGFTFVAALSLGKWRSSAGADLR